LLSLNKNHLIFFILVFWAKNMQIKIKSIFKNNFENYIGQEVF